MEESPNTAFTRVSLEEVVVSLLSLLSVSESLEVTRESLQRTGGAKGERRVIGTGPQVVYAHVPLSRSHAHSSPVIACTHSALTMTHVPLRHYARGTCTIAYTRSIPVAVWTRTIPTITYVLLRKSTRSPSMDVHIPVPRSHTFHSSSTFNEQVRWL